MLLASARSISSRLTTVTILAASAAVSGAREPVMVTSSRPMGARFSESSANSVRTLMPSALACFSVLTLSTPMMTTFPRHAKRA